LFIILSEFIIIGIINVSWKDKVTNASVLEKVKEERCILNTVWQRKRRWLGHVLRTEVLLREIITEARMKAKRPVKERDYIC